MYAMERHLNYKVISIKIWNEEFIVAQFYTWYILYVEEIIFLLRFWCVFMNQLLQYFIKNNKPNKSACKTGKV